MKFDSGLADMLAAPALAAAQESTTFTSNYEVAKALFPDGSLSGPPRLGVTRAGSAKFRRPTMRSSASLCSIQRSDYSSIPKSSGKLSSKQMTNIPRSIRWCVLSSDSQAVSR